MDWIELRVGAATLALGYLMLLGWVFSYQDALVFPGSYLPMKGPQAAGPVQSEILKLPGGRQCRLFVARPKAPRGVILWFVGNGEKGDRCAYWVDALARTRNCTAFSVEYPGYGSSGGRASKDACLAAAKAAADRARTLAKRIGVPLLVGGHSLGTFMATSTAARGIGDKLILVSPPASIRARGRGMFPFLPVRLLLRHDFDNLAPAPNVRCPALVIHGSWDRIVPIAEGRQVATRLGNAKFVEVPRGSHDPIQLLVEAGDALVDFLR